MRRVFIVRDRSTPQGTPGVLTAGMLRLYTLEREWKDNAIGISCIPEGVYKCAPHSSPKFGACIEVKDVPGRTNILFHAGNWAAFPSTGHGPDTEGCILVGNAHDESPNHIMLLGSRDGFKRFMAEMGTDPFEVEIRWANV